MVRVIRIIPAFAGNTHRRACQTSWEEDHPRVCGEHFRNGRMGRRSVGSSPRLRGTPSPIHATPMSRGIIPAFAGNTLVHRHRFAHVAGIIPAFAGNTPSRAPRRRPMSDHPRVCGEHAVCDNERIRPSGSSPRLRGTRNLYDIAGPSTRIIPAFAGNTRWEDMAVCFVPDHPRVCGEHVQPVRVHRVPEGSSPRLRGTLHRFSHVRGT